MQVEEDASMQAEETQPEAAPPNPPSEADIEEGYRQRVERRNEVNAQMEEQNVSIVVESAADPSGQGRQQPAYPPTGEGYWLPEVPIPKGPPPCLYKTDKALWRNNENIEFYASQNNIR